jgi:hypothetical protein
MRARYYNPYLCRFLNADPSGFGGGLNFYAYADGNPVSLIDPFGLGANEPNNTSPWQLGWQWVTGTGPRVQNFSTGDPMTVMLQQHEHIQDTRNIIANNVATGGQLQGNNNYDLSGFQGVPKYVRDYSTLATGGLSGNLAVTYLGSYRLNYNVTGIDAASGTARVNFHVENPSTITSGLRPPVLGYTDWWNRNIGTPLNNLFQSGPMSPTTQIFDWTETIQYSQPNTSSGSWLRPGTTQPQPNK